MDIVIRDATPEDAEAIVAFNSAMATETEGRALDPDLINPGVAAVLGDLGKGRYWVAESNHVVVGQLMTTYEWSDWRNGSLWWIQSVFIDQSHRRQGVYSALYRHVEALARDDQLCCGIRLYVKRDNSRAQQTYSALGMVNPGYEIMEVDFRKENQS